MSNLHLHDRLTQGKTVLKVIDLESKVIGCTRMENIGQFHGLIALGCGVGQDGDVSAGGLVKWFYLHLDGLGGVEGGVANQATMRVPQLTPERQPHERIRFRIKSGCIYQTHASVPTKPIWIGATTWGRSSKTGCSVTCGISEGVDTESNEAGFIATFRSADWQDRNTCATFSPNFSASVMTDAFARAHSVAAISAKSDIGHPFGRDSEGGAHAAAFSASMDAVVVAKTSGRIAFRYINLAFGISRFSPFSGFTPVHWETACGVTSHRRATSLTPPRSEIIFSCFIIVLKHAFIQKARLLSLNLCKLAL